MITLREQLEKIQIDQPKNMPWIVNLLRSPRSLLALPGNISPKNHDCISVILNRNNTLQDQAFISGFCMGNDPKTKLLHIGIFNFCSRHLYPRNYRLNKSDLFFFDLGFAYGRSLSIQFNLIDFSKYKDIPLSLLRREFGIKIDDLQGISNYEVDYQQKTFPFLSQYAVENQSLKTQERKIFYITALKISSSIFGLFGGATLALNTPISGYGFIFLACSSSQMLISSILDKDKLLMCYSGTIFFCVDLLGIYRWVFN